MTPTNPVTWIVDGTTYTATRWALDGPVISGLGLRTPSLQVRWVQACDLPDGTTVYAPPTVPGSVIVHRFPDANRRSNLYLAAQNAVGLKIEVPTIGGEVDVGAELWPWLLSSLPLALFAMCQADGVQF